MASRRLFEGGVPRQGKRRFIVRGQSHTIAWSTKVTVGYLDRVNLSSSLYQVRENRLSAMHRRAVRRPEFDLLSAEIQQASRFPGNFKVDPR